MVKILSFNDELQEARNGKDFKVKRSPVEFSFWPSKDFRGKKTLQFEIFCKEPWSVIEGEIDKRCPKKLINDANAFLSQSKEFYKAATGSGVISNPLLFYYSFLNLVKAQILTEGKIKVRNLNNAFHGIKEGKNPKTKKLGHAYVTVVRSAGKYRSVFNDLLITHGFKQFPKNPQDVKIAHLLPTVVAGHRLWKDSINRKERFVPIYKIKFKQNNAKSIIWINIYILKQDISRFKITHRRLLAESGIGDYFSEVKDELNDKKYDDDEIICFEQKIPIKSTKQPLDKIESLINDLYLRENLWQVATSIPPYRKYYLYLRPKKEMKLAQLPALYALFFYFGSVTRYRPRAFDKMRNSGNYRAFISDFFSTQPAQFLNLLASEFCKRKVVKPAIP